MKCGGRLLFPLEKAVYQKYFHQLLFVSKAAGIYCLSGNLECDFSISTKFGALCSTAGDQTRSSNAWCKCFFQHLLDVGFLRNTQLKLSQIELLTNNGCDFALRVWDTNVQQTSSTS